MYTTLVVSHFSQCRIWILIQAMLISHVATEKKSSEIDSVAVEYNFSKTSSKKEHSKTDMHASVTANKISFSLYVCGRRMLSLTINLI